MNSFALILFIVGVSMNKNKSQSVKGDLFLATVALLVVGGLCVKGAVSISKNMEVGQIKHETNLNRQA